MEAEDVFADEVDDICIFAPKFIEQLGIEVVIIVGEGIQPDIDDVFIIEGHFDAPIEGGAGDAEVINALIDEGNHFVAACFGLHERWVFFNILEEGGGVFGHFEEIAFF